jgi:probable phosphoglycerate mutase
MTDLYIVRHGEGDYQVKKIVPGPIGDKGLSDLGRRQAQRLRDRLAATGEIKADVLIASTLARARETAEIIAPALGLPVQPDDDFQELRPGEADGMTFAEADEKYGSYVDFRKEPFKVLVPGSENWPQFTVRIATALERITSRHQGQQIVLVAHGGIIDVAMIYFFGLNGLYPPPIVLDTHNASITHWNQGWSKRDPQLWRLLKYNDDLHLRGIDTGRVIDWASLAGPSVTGSDRTAVPLPNEAQEQ